MKDITPPYGAYVGPVCDHCGQPLIQVAPLGVVYTIRRISTGDTYIGSSSNYKRRFLNHRASLRGGYGDSVLLQAAWDRHGEADFEFLVLFSCIVPLAHLRDVEQQFIDELKPTLNAQPARGFLPGHKPAPEAIAKSVAARKGRPQPWARENIKLAQAATRGKKVVFTAEHRANISAAARRRATRKAGVACQ